MKHAVLKPRSRRPSSNLNDAILATAALLLLAPSNASDARGATLRTGGTGSAATMLLQIGKALTAQAPGTTLEVVPALGSTGAISAVVDGVLDFAVSARPSRPRRLLSR